MCPCPELLDRKVLAERLSAFRTQYTAWRSGAARGSNGELSDLTDPASTQRLMRHGLHSNSAGDLAQLGEGVGTAEAPPSMTNKPKVEEAEGAQSRTAERALGFAICGMGRAGKIHLGVLGANQQTSVKWLVDVCPGGLPKDTHGAKSTDDLKKALADPTVDCVIVSTPTPSHAPLIRQALEAGKHVFAEKPLCTIPAAGSDTSLISTAEPTATSS